MDLKPPGYVQMPCDSGQQVHLPYIYDNSGCMDSLDSLHTTCMNGTNHISSQLCQYKFDTDGLSIGIDNRCSVTMSNSKQNFVSTLEKLHRVINIFEGLKAHKIY